jgi:putative ABC transport system substrate-binding protein
MRRREFVMGLAGVATSQPLAAMAQQPASHVIGFMSSRSLSDLTTVLAAFRKGLSEAGFVEGQNLSVEYRFADGQYDRLPALATDLVGKRVELLVAAGGEPSALAAKAATSTIPIVFTTGGDPAKIGLVASLSRPGGNATGVSLLTTTPEAKRLGLLRELVPGVKLIGVLIDPNYQEAQAQARELREASQSMDVEVHIANARNPEELEHAFASLVEEKAGALLVTADPFFDTKRDRIVAFAAEHRMPAIYQFREYAAAGGLMSYGISLVEGYRQVGAYAGQILKGAKPSDLPIVQSVKYEFILNMKTATALGLDLSPAILARADEVIE